MGAYLKPNLRKVNSNLIFSGEICYEAPRKFPAGPKITEFWKKIISRTKNICEPKIASNSPHKYGTK